MRSPARWFSGRSLTIKIVTLFLLLLLAALLLAFGLFRAQSERVRRADLDTVARQNAELIAAGIDAMIDNASYTSKMLLSNETLQTTLILGERFSSPPVQRKLAALLDSVAGMQPHLAAMYLFDTTGQRIGVDNYSLQRFSFPVVEDAAWYGQVHALKGFYLLMLNAGEGRPLFGNENVITLVRSIYNLNAQSQLLGTLMLNLRESLITSCFSGASRPSGAWVAVVDEGGEPLLSDGCEFYTRLGAEQRGRLLGTSTQSLFISPLIYCATPTTNAKWHVVTALPLGTDTPHGAISMLWETLLIIALFVVAAALVVVRMVTRPLHLLGQKIAASDAQPRRVDMHTAPDEIGRLKDSYNDMVLRIEQLISRIEQEAERKRQAELHALQAQINPHFLYNTIDTARAMALCGDAQGLNLLLRSLGEFYRNSINNGREVITVKEELDMVRSYLAIQRIRNRDIEVTFEADEAVNGLMIPKLVLQPLVENAIYHGLREAGNKGVITIRTWLSGAEAALMVQDDGAGISDHAIRHALGEGGPDETGFGLRGTVDRLRLYYGDRHRLRIENLQGRGTRITIWIALEEVG